MPITIVISFSNNKKIGIPFKKHFTIKELINEIIKRISLSSSNNYTLEFNGSQLFEGDTLDDLGINENMELILLRSSSSSSSLFSDLITMYSYNLIFTNMIYILDIDHIVSTLLLYLVFYYVLIYFYTSI